jgi:hypothetical protein
MPSDRDGRRQIDHRQSAVVAAVDDVFKAASSRSATPSIAVSLAGSGRKSKATNDFGGILGRITTHHERYGVLVALRRFQ